MVKCAYFSKRFDVLEKQKQKKQKNWIFSKVLGGGEVTIFRLLGFLPKITYRTNGEMCILFRKV